MVSSMSELNKQKIYFLKIFSYMHGESGVAFIL